VFRAKETAHLIGLLLVSSYATRSSTLPFWGEEPKTIRQENSPRYLCAVLNRPLRMSDPFPKLADFWEYPPQVRVYYC
jgi:hypothetical protein